MDFQIMNLDDMVKDLGFKNFAELSARLPDKDARDEAGKTLLHHACAGGDVEKVQVLLERGLDINQGDYDGETPLHYAACFGHAAVAKFLIDKGADVEATNDLHNKPKYIAELYEHPNVADLIKAEIDRCSLQASVAQAQAQTIKKKAKAYI